MTEDEACAVQQRIADERPMCRVELHAVVTTTGRKRWLVSVTHPTIGVRIVVVNAADWITYVSALV